MALTEQALTTVDRLQIEFGQVVDSKLLEPLIEEASAELQAECNRFFYFQSNTVERVAGYGTPMLRPKNFLPIAVLTEVAFDDGTDESIAETSVYRLEDADAGFIAYVNGSWRYTGRHWNDITRDARPNTAELLYRITYAGGYVTPAQEDASISFDYDNELTGPFTANELLTFGNGSTARLHTLVDAGATGSMVCVELVGDPPPDDDTIAGATATADVNGKPQEGGTGIRTLPFDIERAILDMVGSSFSRRGEDKTIVSKRVSKGAITYAAPGLKMTNLPPSAQAVVRRYRRRSIA